ncbi:hypothetical protein TNCV_2364741 [Trichonephila clavipes]|nr:hypothetical protein TNCV_2364741 [Trichonephila clavipes]
MTRNFNPPAVSEPSQLVNSGIPKILNKLVIETQNMMTITEESYNSEVWSRVIWTILEFLAPHQREEFEPSPRDKVNTPKTPYIYGSAKHTSSK